MTIKYSDLAQDGDLTDAGIDYAVELYNQGSFALPEEVPRTVAELIREAWAAMDAGLVG